MAIRIEMLKGGTTMTQKEKISFIGIILLFLLIIGYQQWQIQTLEKKIQPVDLSRIESRLDSLERDTESLESDVQDLDSSVSRLRSDYSSLSYNVDSINDSVNNLNDDLNTLDTDITYVTPSQLYPGAGTYSHP